MDSTKKHQVEILSVSIDSQPLTRGIHVEECKSLLDNLIEQNVVIDHSCGGNGTCGTCHYFILEGEKNISPRDEYEEEFAHDRGFLPEERLACQSFVRGKIKIEIK